MAFENLLKPPHRIRFLLALAAALIAIAVYLTAEHFTVVPATGALDEKAPDPRALGDRSIVVIPVPGEAQGPLSHAVALELARLLAQVPEIKVIAPRSALAFPGLRQYAEKNEFPFQTAWILEIRTGPQGNEERLSALLFEAAASEPAWSLKQAGSGVSVFDFVGEITATLAGRFGFEPPAVPNMPQGIGPSAYRDYLVARFLQMGGEQDLQMAGRLLDNVVQRAPEWARALAARAYNALLRAAAGGQEAEELLQKARSDLQEASVLEPGLPEAHLYRSLIAHRFDWDWDEAYAAAQDALALAPGDAAILAAASTAAFTLGKFDESAEYLRKAIALDPLVLSHRLKYGLVLEYAGRHEGAIDAYRELMIRNPDYPGAHAYLGRTLVLVGGRAQAALRHMEIEHSPFWRLYGTTLALYALDREPEAEQKLQRFVSQHGHQAAVQIAEIHAYAGRKDEAFEWLATAVEQRDPGVAELIGNPLLSGLKDDPRWEELLASRGLPLG